MKNKLYRKLFLYFVSIIVLTTLLIGIVTYALISRAGPPAGPAYVANRTECLEPYRSVH